MYDSVIDKLVEEPYSFSLFQAIYLVEETAGVSDRVGHFGNPEHEVIRIRNVAALTFPASQINSVEVIEDGDKKRYCLSTPIMGLYGILSPLPTMYTSSLIGEQEDGERDRARLMAFLDIFNHRLLSLAYRADGYRHIHRSDRKSDGQDDRGNSFESSIFSLTGVLNQTARVQLGDWIFSYLPSNRMLAFGARSAAGLKAWLRFYYPDYCVTIEEFTPHWTRIPVDELAMLGTTNCRLAGDDGDSGHGTTIGEWILDRETRFRVTLGPLDWDEFLALLPGSKDHNSMLELILLFTPDMLEFDFKLRLIADECHHLRVCLDGETSRLGLTTGLFSEHGSDTELQLVLDICHADPMSEHPSLKEHANGRAA